MLTNILILVINLLIGSLLSIFFITSLKVIKNGMMRNLRSNSQRRRRQWIAGFLLILVCSIRIGLITCVMKLPIAVVAGDLLLNVIIITLVAYVLEIMNSR